jgi:ABC-type transport system involved in multi-copper enzyme maturation permease subunit
MTAPAPSPPVAPHRSQAGPGGDGFARLLNAEWTKFRTVRGWVVGILVAGLLTIVPVVLLQPPQCAQSVSGQGPGGQTIAPQTTACPGPLLGPGGEAVTDSFYFVHQALPGDGTITVRVTALAGLQPPAGGPVGSPGNPLAGLVPGVQPWTKAGIIIKASTTPGTAYAAMLVTGGNGVRMQYDYTGDTAGLPGAVTASSPRWLRLVRSGDTVTGYDSLDGAHWTRVGAVTLPGLPQAAQAGLFTTSPNQVTFTQSVGSGSASASPTLATASFDRLATSWPAGRWTGSYVDGDAHGPGGPGSPASDPFNGGYKQAGGAFTVTGSGDIAPAPPGTLGGGGADQVSPTPFIAIGTFFALIAAGIVGAVFITAEYRRGLIRTTLTASPRRGRVLAAKAVVLAAVTFAVGLIGTAIALPVEEAQIRRGGSVIPVPALTAVQIIVGTAALMAVASVLALALGFIARRGVAAVSAVIVLIVLPFLFAFIPGLLPPGASAWVLRVFPAAAFAVQQAAPAYHQVVMQLQPARGYYPLAWWAGFLVLCAWAAIALAAAAYLLKRRDA